MKTELVVQCWNWFYIIDCKLQQFESNNWSQAAHKDLGCCSRILAVTQQRDWPWAGLECTVSKVERVFHLTLLPIEGSGLHIGTQKKSRIISIVCVRERKTQRVRSLLDTENCYGSCKKQKQHLFIWFTNSILKHTLLYRHKSSVTVWTKENWCEDCKEGNRVCLLCSVYHFVRTWGRMETPLWGQLLQLLFWQFHQ